MCAPSVCEALVSIPSTTRVHQHVRGSGLHPQHYTRPQATYVQINRTELCVFMLSVCVHTRVQVHASAQVYRRQSSTSAVLTYHLYLLVSRVTEETARPEASSESPVSAPPAPSGSLCVWLVSSLMFTHFTH